jgi:ABC-2 type transport system permease protein
MAVIGIPQLELAASLGFLAIGCLVALWLASRIYRIGLLMYGKRPSMREIARWVTYAR